LSENKSPIRVIDVCTGAGNLAIALAYHVSDVDVYASDLSVEAVALAKRNAKHTKVEKRVTVYQGDFLEPFKTDMFLGKTDILCCNPPYISSGNVEKMHKEIHDHEPDLAFDGGPFGIKILTRLIKEAPMFLVPDGYICFEVGLGQGPAMVKRLTKSSQFQDIISANDEQDQIRAIRARFAP
jgi:release factor glutamine methyltransferase